MPSQLLLPTIFCLAMAFGAISCEAGNPILEELTGRGVAVADQESVTLPVPSMIDGLSTTAQRKAMETVAEGKQTWATLTRRSVLSPFVLKMTGGGEGASQKIGRRIDLSFVAYGDLDYLGSDKFLSGRFLTLASSDGSQAGPAARLLTDAELTARGFPLPKQVDDPRWMAAECTLLDRVQVQVTTRNMRTTTSESLLIASTLDQQFQQDDKYPNRWRSIARDDSGRERIGDWQPYRGLGSYVKVTQLAEPPGALFVEYHLAFAEPPGWFRGVNLLRSKLPIVAQDAVRRFRRHLEQK